MKHVEFLHPDRIILSNYSKSTSYREFTKDMRSRKFKDLRLLVSNQGQNYIRYKIDNNICWYQAELIQKKGKDYYFEILLILNFENIEDEFKVTNREEKLNKLLK